MRPLQTISLSAAVSEISSVEPMA